MRNTAATAYAVTTAAGKVVTAATNASNTRHTRLEVVCDVKIVDTPACEPSGLPAGILCCRHVEIAVLLHSDVTSGNINTTTHLARRATAQREQSW